MKGLMVAAAVPVLAVAACGGSQRSTTGMAPPGPRASLTAPADVAPSARLLDARSVHQMLRSSHPVVLLFMATGCESCAAEAHELVTANGDPPVQLIGVDVAPDDSGALTQFLDAAGLSVLPFAWTIDTDGSLSRQFSVQALEQTVGVVGGVVRFTNASAADASELRTQIAGLR